MTTEHKINTSTPKLDKALQIISEKIDAGERLSFEEGLFLEESVDLQTLGALANKVREQKNGNYAFYNTNIHLNPTNVCVYRCEFCAFRADLKSERAYSIEEQGVRERVHEAMESGATEIHVVGGLHHQKKFDWYLNVIHTIRETSSRLHIKAWTPVEIYWFSYLTKKPYEWVFQQMIDAGLGSMPGGGAEIFHPDIRSQICEHKSDAANWLEIHELAHSLGLRTNATMLYGHLEQAEHRIDHLLKLRELQDKTNGFQTFIPLAFHPENTNLSHLKKANILTDLKVIAVSRLMLDNFDHIKAYWVMLGEKTAQVALGYGADDIDGTVVHELIYHDAGAKTPEGMTVEQLHRLIRETGREPIERDTLYRQVIRNGKEWEIGKPLLQNSNKIATK